MGIAEGGAVLEAVALAAVRDGLGIGVCQAPLSQRAVPLVRVLPRLALHIEAWVVMLEDLRAVGRVRVVYEHLVAGLAAYASPRR